MPVRTPLPFRPPPGEPMPPPVPTSTPLTPPPIVPDRGSRLARSGRYNVTHEDLRPYLSTCPACGGPSARLRIDVDPAILQPPGFPSPNFEEIAGWGKYLRENTCSSCELKEIIGRLFPTRWAAPVQDPAQEELQRLRAELARPSAPEAPPSIAGALFGILEPVRVTPAAGVAAGRLAAPGETPEDYLRALIELHATGDFGLIGRHSDGDPRLGSGGNPLASVVDRNRAAIEEGRGSVRSVYLRARTERWKDPNSMCIERTREIARVEFGAWTVLPTGLTLVALASELAGSG